MAGYPGLNKGKKNALGNRGGHGAPTVQDRKLSQEVRRLTLRELKRILSKPKNDYDLYKAILIKLAGAVLPRLNEISGENGGPIQVQQITGMEIIKEK